jgi:hypothetical protein
VFVSITLKVLVRELAGSREKKERKKETQMKTRAAENKKKHVPLPERVFCVHNN